jgi:hypothetical protein
MTPWRCVNRHQIREDAAFIFSISFVHCTKPEDAGNNLLRNVHVYWPNDHALFPGVSSRHRRHFEKPYSRFSLYLISWSPLITLFTIRFHIKKIWRSWVRASQIYSTICPTRCNFKQFIYIWKLLYMFRVLLPPIIRSAYKCIYSIWYSSHLYCYLPL